MKRRINCTKISSKSLITLYLLNKRNKDIKNKKYIVRNVNFFFNKFHVLLRVLSNFKTTSFTNANKLHGLYRQVNLIYKYNSKTFTPVFIEQKQNTTIYLDNNLVFSISLVNLFELYKLLQLLNQNLYVTYKI